MRTYTLPILAALLGCCSLTACTEQPPPAEQAWELVWSDEFEQEGLLDDARWSYAVGGHGWGNQELQYYTEARPENARVENGKLIITAVPEAYEGKPFTSARVTTSGKADWQYGRFEIRARLPGGLGTWPAIWMMPAGWSFEQGGWPDVGEIDIMEHVGHEVGTVHASAHSRDYQWQKGTQKTGTIQVPDATEAFHTYVLEWTAEALRAYVDDEPYFEYINEGEGSSKWPYDKPFYLILNIAVGGAWGGQQGVDTTAFPQSMEVEYVRVYQERR